MCIIGFNIGIFRMYNGSSAYNGVAVVHNHRLAGGDRPLRRVKNKLYSLFGRVKVGRQLPAVISYRRRDPKMAVKLWNRYKINILGVNGIGKKIFITAETHLVFYRIDRAHIKRTLG